MAGRYAAARSKMGNGIFVIPSIRMVKVPQKSARDVISILRICYEICPGQYDIPSEIHDRKFAILYSGMSLLISNMAK